MAYDFTALFLNLARFLSLCTAYVDLFAHRSHVFFSPANFELRKNCTPPREGQLPKENTPRAERVLHRKLGHYLFVIDLFTFFVGARRRPLWQEYDVGKCKADSDFTM